MTRLGSHGELEARSVSRRSRGSSRRAKREEGQTGGEHGREVGADAASLQLLSGLEATAVPRAAAHRGSRRRWPL